MTAKEKTRRTTAQGGGVFDGRIDFSQGLLRHAAQDKPRVDFLSDALMLILRHAGCDAVEIRLEDKEGVLRYEASARGTGEGAFQTVSGDTDSHGFEQVCAAVLSGMPMPFTACCTRYGSVCFDDTREPLCPAGEPQAGMQSENARIGGLYRSLALVPLSFGKERTGLLVFKSMHRKGFSPEKVGYLETIAAKLELAFLHHLSQSRLRERVKELTCLYGIAQIASNPSLSFEQKLGEIVLLLPPAWQYPDRACARIIAEGIRVETPGFKEGKHRQEAPIRISGRERGTVEIHYCDDGPFLQKNPFIDEEQSLIDNIAGQISLMVERKEAEASRSELQKQLIRADRLAAIGQLAAGVAHELNEPLNTILGFAQLTQKAQGMPRQAMRDIGRIADASLHARNIIRELLIFARQVAPDRSRVSLNRIVEDELGLFETLCRKSGVEFKRILDPCLPDITADRSQVLQVAVNLIGNALQAMPDGGVLTLRTSYDSPMVCLAVEDTGAGMSEEVKENIFLPFFTTKDVNEGTGLGLSVVHGIVSSHNGGIRVESEQGKGTRFLVTFPASSEAALEEDA